ncbi:hypothetical protein RHGRI_037242 [Rhododendron griersonianum]|uniref:Lactoylglutathione lyase n=1 Tax=Rhododendron griersonianum TaxID=479676 RepID=A0AAV6HVA9_9ERIC|nr:hypothetical protein RHGRI_037242 [Rhododendron griersonianum]
MISPQPFLSPEKLARHGTRQCGNEIVVDYEKEAKHVSITARKQPHLSAMADVAPVVLNDEILEWPKNDKRRFLHVVYRVGDLDRSIKFYTEAFGMTLLRKKDVPKDKYSSAVLGFGQEESTFVVELIHSTSILYQRYYGVENYDIGTGFGHFGISTTDIYQLVETIRAKGGKITQEAGAAEGTTAVVAFVQDLDGYEFELFQRDATPEPLCQVMFHVVDLDRSIEFYEKALGMNHIVTIDRPEEKDTIAMLGYGDDPNQIAILELIYNYDVTEYTKGNAYSHIAISTDDVYKSAEVVKLVTLELGGKIIRQPGPFPGTNTKFTAFEDPEGWKTVLIDNQDFLKGLEE